MKDSIDREKKDTLHVTVTASDSGVPSRNSSIDVRLGRVGGTLLLRYPALWAGLLRRWFSDCKCSCYAVL